MSRMIVLRAEPVTREAWAPFGSIPSDEGSDGGCGDLEFLWNDGRANFISHSYDEVPHNAAGSPICELLNRHDTHTQTLMPMNCDAVVVVASASVDFSEPGAEAKVKAFLLHPHEVVHLARGTWHWGPFPVSAPDVRIFNIQGTGYPRDNGIAWLARDHGVAYEVTT